MDLNEILFILLIFLLAVVSYVMPILLTVFNTINLIKKKPIKEGLIDGLTFILGIILTVLLFSTWSPKDYIESIIIGGGDYELHTPIASWHMPTVIVLAVIGLIGYILLRVKKDKLSPIISILCISAIYIDIILSITYIIQLSKNFFYDRRCPV